MRHRIKGIVSKFENKQWYVSIHENMALLHGKEIVVASTHGDIFLAVGLSVDFHMVHITGIVSALDVDFIDADLLPEISKTDTPNTSNISEDSVLWDIVRKTNDSLSQSIEKELAPARGGTKHRFIQHLIKKAGERNGFIASIEKQIDTGEKIDVLLEKSDLLIACEVAITNISGEVNNIRKCLLHNQYTYVVSVYDNQKNLESVKRKFTSESNNWRNDVGIVRFMMIEDFIAFLEKLTIQTTAKITKMKGYTIRTEYALPPRNEEERNAMKQKMERVMSIMYSPQNISAYDYRTSPN